MNSRCGARMDRLAQLRAPHRDAIEADLRASDAGRCLLRDAQRLDGLMRHAATALHEGQLTRADALALVVQAQAAYRSQHGELLVATRARHAASDASAAHMAGRRAAGPRNRRVGDRRRCP
ncbi:MAG: hypothetical protein H7337_16845 [Rhizobacter sp.]|nr:hypothetical protein [Rhizobacter sp.]